ncbi:DUF1329 domain-containing protein [Candidatus Binatus sp.]|uniref:DUF1329 domain-containing protein n=1 Tax=Candidatus Binatus sp. TaxID=2811406 RepID=UPI003C638853
MLLGTLRIRKTFVVGSIALLVLAAMSLPSEAGVKPGDFITPDNASQVKDMVSPGVFYKVMQGMTMKISPTTRIDWPPPYKDATEKYSSQVQLSKDHRSLIGYVAGQPFPLIDANDPDVATKVVWNNVFRPITTDDYDLRYYDCDTVYTGRNKPFSEVWYYQTGHYAGYDLVGRTEVEPLPIDPDFKKTNRLWLFLLGPQLAPQDGRGTSLLRYRYAAPNHGDDSWTWTSGTRRLRRLNEAIMSSASGPYSWDPDHYSGFNPKTEQYDYKLIGEKEMLATVEAEHSPEIRCATDGGGSACPERWQMRHMYIVTAEPRRDVSGGESAGAAIDSKTVIYMDSEMWFEPYIDTYDRRGELFRNHIYWLAYRDRPVPDAKVAIYPFKREFVVGAVSTDVQSSQASMCYLPGIETAERECWYINMGAVDKAFFTTEAMVKMSEVGHM